MAMLNSIGIEFNLQDRTYRQFSVDQFDINLEDETKIYWLHCDLNQPEIFKRVMDKLHLSDDFINLCDPADTMPKLVDTGESLTIRIQSLLSDELKQDQEAVFENLVIYLTEHYCLTVASSFLPALAAFTEVAPKAIKYAQTPCFILFLILDNVINDYSKILFHFDLIADELDMHIDDSNHNIYSDVMDKKNQVMKIKRYVAAIRDILMRISGRKLAVISEQCRLSLGNLFDHSQMVVAEADAVRDILNGTLDKIDNALMQKMNETMKILTGFAAIFLPMTLIAGIYGMNFTWIPELQWKYGYWWALFLMLLCGGFLLYLFKKMRWF